MHRALDITEQMLDAARENDWSRVTALEVARRDALHGDLPVHALRDRNLELVALANSAQQVAQGRLHELNSRRTAERAYRVTAD